MIKRALLATLAVALLLSESLAGIQIIRTNLTVAASGNAWSDGFADRTAWTTDYCTTTNGGADFATSGGMLLATCYNAAGTLYVDQMHYTTATTSRTGEKQYAAVQWVGDGDERPLPIVRSTGVGSTMRYVARAWTSGGDGKFALSTITANGETEVRHCYALHTGAPSSVNDTWGLDVSGAGTSTVLRLYFWGSSAAPEVDHANWSDNLVMTCTNGTAALNTTGWTVTSGTANSAPDADAGLYVGLGVWRNNEATVCSAEADSWVGGEW